MSVFLSFFFTHVTVHSPSLKGQETGVGSVHLPHPVRRVQLGAVTALNLPRSRAITGTAKSGCVTVAAAFKRISQAKNKT